MASRDGGRKPRLTGRGKQNLQQRGEKEDDAPCTTKLQQVWTKPLSNGSAAIGFFNLGDEEARGFGAVVLEVPTGKRFGGLVNLWGDDTEDANNVFSVATVVNPDSPQATITINVKSVAGTSVAMGRVDWTDGDGVEAIYV
jgi:hypothetical protein